MRRVRTSFRQALSLVVVVLAAAACDADGPAGETILSPDVAAKRVAGGSALASASATGGFLPGWSSADADDLKPLLEVEKARIDAEKKLGDAQFDPAKRAWDAFKELDYDKTKSPFLMCDPRQYAAETKIIGPEGGEIGMGPHKLRIPAGALSQYTVITGEAPVTITVATRLSPHGLEFLKQPLLILDYSHCYTPQDFGHRLAYVNANDEVLELPPAYDEARNDRLYGWISHFSLYKILKGYTPAGG